MRADWAPLEGTAGVQARAGVRRSVDPNSRPAQSGQDLDRTGRALVELPASAEPWPSVGLADLHPGREAIGEGVVVDGLTHPPNGFGRRTVSALARIGAFRLTMPVARGIAEPFPSR